MRREVRPWIEEQLRRLPKPRRVVELGAHHGEDTEWLAAISTTTVVAVEPDPRNVAVLRRRLKRLPNVQLVPAAVASFDGRCDLWLSEAHPRKRLVTASSSIREPTGHLTYYPRVTFGGKVEVDCLKLDTICAHLPDVSFIWADIQGAEVDMINGGRETLARTRWLYTEVCPDGVEPWYAGQVCYSELLMMLPGWRVLRKFPTDVLLENECLPPP